MNPVTLTPEKDPDRIQGQRLTVSTVCDEDWIDYEELYDELFSRAEQSIGAQLHPIGKNGGDG